MSVSRSSDLAGILPVVVSGNRPRLYQRCTTRLLGRLRGVTADPLWLVRDHWAPRYERDGYELVTFPSAEAEAYAAAHWIGPEPYRPGSVLGAFTEREWACRLAAERGYWAVLLLDDNIMRLDLFTGYGAARRTASHSGGLALFADLLAATTRATNSRMTGARLSAVRPEPGLLARAGIPYSLYLERVDLPDRQPYYGPFEEDILHALQYGSRADDATAAILIPLGYSKEHVRSANSGQRPAYRSQRRAAGIQAVAPELVKVQIRKAHANGRGEARVFHQMPGGAMRTPLVVTDSALMNAVRDRVAALRAEVGPLVQADANARVEYRARKAERRQAALDRMRATIRR